MKRHKSRYKHGLEEDPITQPRIFSIDDERKRRNEDRFHVLLKRCRVRNPHTNELVGNKQRYCISRIMGSDEEVLVLASLIKRKLIRPSHDDGVVTGPNVMRAK
ncbi:hypothetical protein EVAR_54805_1 [Eumeta japonica]|uniref:Uncharacterized protein n=1 Tax=Eumeta variegata TaxID=151549 RepID=A0A4C1Y0G3_EUMVA|nr:hypothetical protein EVAR_54805_1 [Eumeta japonica]